LLRPTSVNFWQHCRNLSHATVPLSEVRDLKESNIASRRAMVLKNLGAPLATKFCIQIEVGTKREVGVEDLPCTYIKKRVNVCQFHDYWNRIRTGIAKADSA
jgi:hypothetical protein